MKPQTFLQIITTSVTITLTCALISHARPAAWWNTVHASHSAHNQLAPVEGEVSHEAASASQWLTRAISFIPSHWSKHSDEGVEEAHRAGSNWQFWANSWLHHEYIGHMANKAVSSLWLSHPLLDCGGQVG